jgi:hypothetical protein
MHTCIKHSQTKINIKTKTINYQIVDKSLFHDKSASNIIMTFFPSPN